MYVLILKIFFSLTIDNLFLSLKKVSINVINKSTNNFLIHTLKQIRGSKTYLL